MLFNSIDFAVFFPVVFVLYWLVGNRSLPIQNGLLLAASYFFYACWDVRFLGLLLFSTTTGYVAGLKISEAQHFGTKKVWFWGGLLVQIGLLGLFKYYNFFVTSFTAALSLLNVQINPATLSIILPVGISFYTFHGLSYLFDSYEGKIRAEKSFITYALFVSFFPLLVAGPIERATHLLPQLNQRRTFDYVKAVDGLRQILWGLFKKVVIADQCAEYANLIFGNPTGYSGGELVLGAFFFAFQMYGDFSGYSDIALGTARLLGIELLRNFAFPFFSRNVAEYWRRWHISLSSWFRDYLYIPLGGSWVGLSLQVRNVFIVFVISGLWHGANWTFLIWGALNAVFFIPLLLTQSNRKYVDTVAQGKIFPTIKELFLMLGTFGLTAFARIFFRAESISAALVYISGIFTTDFFSLRHLPEMHKVIMTLLLIGVFLLIEWGGREQPYALAKMGVKWRRPLRYAAYYAMIMAIIWFSGKDQPFIYFQF